MARCDVPAPFRRGTQAGCVDVQRAAVGIVALSLAMALGIVHALTLLGVILAAAPLARYIPLATLSAVLVNVALNMGEWHNFTRLPRWPKSDTAVCARAASICFFAA